jgi:N-glycosylase/DNA lyase
MSRISELISQYKKVRSRIKDRLQEFRQVHKASDKDIFAELSFCILTPQAKALNCDRAVRQLKESGLLFKGCAYAIAYILKGLVRFHNNKADYIVVARDIFKKGNRLDIKGRLDMKNIRKTRDWLVKNIKGLGYKEASHFLRNIGLGKNIAILDRHILKNLKRYGVINEIPKSITKNRYLDIEEKMRTFCRRIDIPLADLDLLFWHNQTGFIFK